MFHSMDSAHFEMSELNAVSYRNTAESKKEEREREKQRIEGQIVKMLEKKQEEVGKVGKGEEEREVVVKEKR